jgi:putative membrane protein
MAVTHTRSIHEPEQLKTPPSVIAAILGISAAASVFLCWLVYFHAPADATHSHLLFLPALNAFLNGCSAIALVVGFSDVKHGRLRQHRAAMFSAFIFSSIFLVSYITNHALHGDSHLPVSHSTGIWYAYATLLTSHIILSIVALPMILITFFFSLTQRFRQHRSLARWTFPIWLYVSITGVMVYMAQAVIRG